MPDPVLEFADAGLSFGPRALWSGLSLRVEPGEFIAVLGANGSGKTSMVRTILALERLRSGTVRVSGRPARRGADAIGYVPQQRRVEPLTPLRARDMVGQGPDGHRWGLGRRGHRAARVAAALVAGPRLLLCDEPLLSLDLRSQRMITALVDRQRREKGTAVVFVTHEINPVLPYVDRVLYLARGKFRVGTVEEVFTSATLSDLYGVPIEVVNLRGRILVAGVPEAEHD